MVHRRILIVAVWSVTGMFWLTEPSVAQDADRSAEALLAQGHAQLQAGDYAEAHATLSRVQAERLSAAKRTMLAERLVAVKAKLAASADAEAEALALAQEAGAVSQPLAAKMPTDVKAAQPAVKAAPAKSAGNGAALAQARRDIQLAEVEVGVAGEFAQDGRDFAAATKLASAERRLRGVQANGVVLGWHDRQRVTQLRRRIGEYREQMGVQIAQVENGPIDAAALAQADGDDDAGADAAGADDKGDEPAAPPADADGADDAPPADADDLISEAQRVRVQELIAEADAARAAGNVGLAVRSLRAAAALDPTNAEVQTRLQAAEAARGGAVGEKELLPRFVDDMEIRRQATEAEFKELKNRANNLREQNRFAEANDAVQQAKLILDQQRRFLPPAQYDQLRADATALAAQIDSERIEFEEANRKAIEAERVKEATERAERAERERREEVQRLLRRANDLRKEQQYDKALELLDQALFLDPNNVAAQALRDVIQDTQVFRIAARSVRRRAIENARQSALNIGATIAFSDVMVYPSDWPQITAVRLAGLDTSGGESEVNRRTAAALRNPVPINFEAIRLSNVIEYLRNTTGLNFFVNWAALEAVGIERDTPITLRLSNVPAEQALRLVLAQAGSISELEPIGFSIIEGIVTVSTERDLNRTTDTRVYDIRDLLVQVPNFAGAPEFDLNSALSNTSSGGSAGQGVAQSSTDLFGDDDTEENQLTREELIEQIITLIQDTVGDQEDWGAYGGEIGSLRELNGNLIVKQTPENHRQVIQLLAQLRETRAIQIHIEARFLLVDQNFLEEVGVDLDIQVDNLGGKFGPIKLAQDSISVAGRASTGLPGTFGAPLDIAPIGAFIPMEGFTPPSGRSLDFNISFIDDFQVNLLVRASEQNRRSINLTAPRVTLFNGQRSNVVIARQIAFVSDLEPIPGATGFDPTLSVTQSGVVLDVEATVSADRRYVTMTARPSLATVLQPIRTIPQQGTTTTTGVGTGQTGVGTAFGFIEAPELELTSVRTSVSVPDKGTLIMGGQRLVADVEVEAGVPIMSKIPVLNRLFTNRTTIKDERTLLVLIKPTVLLQNEQEDALFPGLLDNPQQYNIGRTFGAAAGISSSD